MSNKPDTSSEAVIPVATALLAMVPAMKARGQVLDARTVEHTAALLCALVEERDEALRIANGGCARDQRTTQYCSIAADAYARGQAEMRERAAALIECQCQHRGEVAVLPPDSAKRWKLCPASSCAAIEAAAIRALPLGARE